MTDAEAVQAARSGDRHAFALLVERYHGATMRFAQYMLGRDGDAEDAVQETFMRIYGTLGRYRERESFRAWLFQILVNRCRTLGARRRRRDARFVRDERELERAAIPGDGASLDASRRLSRALEGLEDRHREAFLLEIGEGLEYEEMARLTGDGVSALKMRVKRARDHVRARWQENGHALG